MTEPRILTEDWTAAEPVLVESPEAPHSGDPAGRNVPAAKLDWSERLPFQQVRGLEVAPGPERILPGPGGSGDNPG